MARFIKSPWYIGTPYSKFVAGLDAAYDEACKIRARFIDEGIPSYCPIAELHGPARFVTLADPRDSKFWQTVCKPLMQVCGGMAYVRLSGYEESIGLLAEEVWFRSVARPIVYVDPDDLDTAIAIIKRMSGI
jgi:hypothetical protein